MPKPLIPNEPPGQPRTLVLQAIPTAGICEEPVRQARRRRRRWAFFWALAIHTTLLIVGALWQTQPDFIAQIGNALTMSSEEAVDRQQESTEDKPVEKVVIQSTAGPPPRPSEAAIPELVPILETVDIPMPEPSESFDLVEMDFEIADIGVSFGEGLEGEDVVEEVLETKMFSAPAKGNCAIFAIDVSTSMPKELGDVGIASLRRDLRLKIDALPEDQLFNIICCK